MAIHTVCVLGGTGFVGRHIVRLLCEQGYAVRVPTRSAEKARQAFGSLTVEIIEADVHDWKTLGRLFAGMDAVINLVGILHEEGLETFERAHVILGDKVVEAAKVAATQRVLHMSALNAAPAGPSIYLRTKGIAEKRVLTSGLPATVFRPSVIFGEGDSFLTLFARIAKWAPVLPLASASAKFQPVWVQNVAQAFVHSLGDASTIGQHYNLCGPRVYTLSELVAFAAACAQRHPIIVPLPDSIGYLQAWAMECLPRKLLTRDNLDSMKQDSVCDTPFPFGIIPAALEDIAPKYLSPE